MKKLVLSLACISTCAYAAESEKTRLLVYGDQPPAYDASINNGGSSSHQVAIATAPAPMAAMGDISQITAAALQEHALGPIDRKDQRGTVNIIQGYLQNTSSSKRNFIKAVGACALAAAQDDTGFFDHMLSKMLEPDSVHTELFKYADVFQDIGTYRKDVHREYLALAANKGSVDAQTDFKKHFPTESFVSITPHAYDAPYKDLVAQRNSTDAQKIYDFARVMLEWNSVVKRSEVRALGLTYYLLHAHPDKYYGYDLQAEMAQTSHLINITPQEQLEITQEYKEKFFIPTSLKRYAWALEKNGRLYDAFKAMRCVTYGLLCNGQAHRETSRLAKQAYPGDEYGKASCCCCYTDFPCLCTCCCD